ncbi:hypothetical protein [Alkalimarinus alittae]|uniref:Uncharacterized protein n=1 Tax=Alkalimarinus alittae TaxID=2961619 RepID=A0ABY6MYA2_9ALTE|nr:hypothetical protein [Alkalimarinus alittae]UZE94813.1 hypothetical protein NKI27_12065 [Alkalimarinus alittae]
MKHVEKNKNEGYCAERIGPFHFMLPQKISDFLSNDVVCTLLPNLILGSEYSDDEGVFIALIPSDVWMNSLLPDIESSSWDKPEGRRLQRLALGYVSKVQCINGCIDLTSLKSIIKYSVEHGCLHDGDMLLSLGEQSVRMDTPR